MGKRTRVLFVEPPRISWFLMGDHVAPPAPLLVLAGYLRREMPDIEVEVLDCVAERKDWDGIRKAIESSKPSIVVSSGFTTNAYTCVRAAEIAKTVDSSIVTIVGGSYFSFMSEESLKDYQVIDFVVRGEGEETLVDLVRSLRAGKGAAGVKGVSYRSNGGIVHNPERPLIADLDSLPYPAYDLVEGNIKRYHFTLMTSRDTPYLLLEGSRGCAHKCSFCTQWRHWQGTYRMKSAKRVADEIEHLNETFGGVFLWFTDDNFEYSRRAGPLWEELRHRKCKDDIMLFLQARTDDVAANPDMVHKMRDVGNYWVLMGVESHSDERLKEFRKGIMASDAAKAVRTLNDNDIFSQAMFVCGSRNDTRESIEAQRQFSLDLGTDLAIYTVLTPFPGTALFEIGKQNGWIEDFNFTNYDMVHAIMPTETLTTNELQRELFNNYRAFYGSYMKGIAGVFSRKKLKRNVYRHMASQHVLRKLRGLV